MDRMLSEQGVPRTTGEQEEGYMGLYERLLEERRREERRRGRPLGAFHGLDSPVLDRRLADASKDRPRGYRGDLRLLHRYANEGARGQSAAMRFASLRARYRKDFAELKAEAQGQGASIVSSPGYPRS
jgi:hypothetical protein